MTEPFGHLHRHGEFSRLDGVGTAKQAATHAAELGQPFLAQTDHGTLSGALHHIVACREKKIVPITGVEAYYRPNRMWRAPIIKPHQAWHLVLLVKNLRGWHNLLRLVSTAYAEQEDGGGFYQYPCVDDELLDKYSEGLIATSACFQSWIANLINSGDSAAVRDYVQVMKKRFGDDFYLEIMPHDFDEQRTLNNTIVDLSYEFSVPLLATSDAHFVYPDWAETQRVSKMMATKLTFSKVEQMLEKGEEPPYTSELHPTLYISSRDEMRKWFVEYHPDLEEREIDEALSNTALLAGTIKPFLLDRSDKLPKVTKDPNAAEQILSGWIDEGFARIRKEYPQSHWVKWDSGIYEDRINFEWEILKSKGALPYMVMVADIIRWAKSQDIRIGLGRGSAAGCLISYLVGITAVDPIPWGLLFERFLNPGRKGMPDIDVDVQSNRRAEVKEYVIKKYGADHVADIITHERFQPKSVLQRLCAVFDVPYIEAKKVTDTIDIRQDDEETTLEELLPINETLREFKGKYPHIWEHAIRLDQSVANYGKHAAGVVITPEPIIEYMALERGKKGDLVTSWSDSADFMVISDYGFIKIDLLGIQGLERHDYACKLIRERHGIDIDLNKLGPLRDPYDVEQDVLKLFTDGYTVGLFQFGSKGMTTLIRSIAPDNAFDLCAANALYRPGAMKSGATWDYARIKRGDKEPEFPHPLAEPVLAETFGLIAYQEQIMELSKSLAGFTPAQADDLRKAMGKLYRIKGGKAAKEYMQQHRQLWVAGTKANNISKEVSDEIWGFVLDRSSYNFNKSHSGCYGLQAYQDAWLKHHYPLEMYAAILTYPSGGTPAAKQEFIDKMTREAKSRGIRFLPPDVNSSELGWIIDDEGDGEGLRFNLIGIKDVGEVAAAKIIANRDDGYWSIEEVRERCGTKVNKKVIEALTEAGAFDTFGARKGWSGRQIAMYEKERLRMVIKGVLESDKYADLIRPNIYTEEEVEALPNGVEAIIGGEITKIEKKLTKNGKPFANLTVAFEMNEWRVKLWSNALDLFEDLLEVGNTVMINGKKDEWNGFISVVCNDMCSIASMTDDEREKMMA